MAFRFFGLGTARNDPVRLVDPHPIPNYGTHDEHSGSVPRDGYELLSKADPRRQGAPPPVDGTVGPTFRGPDESFEQ